MMARLSTPLALALAALAYFIPAVSGGAPVVYAACTTIAILAVMAYGADLILSYLGEVSLGHTIFWATGGYAAAMLAVNYGWNGWATAAAAIVAAVVLACVLGLVTLRTREFVFSLVTYAAAVVAMEVAFNWSFLGGSDGIVGVPPLALTIFGWGVSGTANTDLWPIAWLLLMATLLFIHRFRRSRLGTSALMVQMNPDLATALGVDARRVRLAVFVTSAPISALAGWLYAYQRAYVGPDMFESYFLVLMLTAIVIIGRRLLLGPLIGTALIIVQQTFFSIGGDGDKIILGAVLAAILLLWPKGLIGLWDVAARQFTARRRRSSV
ncbi:branched-chain amino acid ABC transporter permease [Vineibacter terrae]|uniref:branched-chain amino acid ABC transporter permease n=1 Tax=Vineibacter terrae TaxID=2586908 RepID=UPI002E364B5F|nr:branched-chain amino acid ABC transporter permease [Vineibacter terrae]HEX2887723.1 branched-chain amino acid ABC transporter permease [Vineibacter terrae]